VFPVSVYPIVYLVRRELPDAESNEVLYEKMKVADEKTIDIQLSRRLKYSIFSDPRSPWAIFSSTTSGSLIERLKTFQTLSSIADVLGAATVAEAYEIAEIVREGRSNENSALREPDKGVRNRIAGTFSISGSCREITRYAARGRLNVIGCGTAECAYYIRAVCVAGLDRNA
jgi:hypothetical protein